MDPDCAEPTKPEYAVGGAGPEKVYCCKTAQEKVADLEEKQAQCAEPPAVPCWKSLVKILPDYIAYYKEQVEKLCGEGGGAGGNGDADGAWCHALCEEGMSEEACAELCSEVARKMKDEA